MVSVRTVPRARSPRPEAVPTGPAGAPAAAPRYALDFDERLAEEAVLLAVARAPAARQTRFHEERDQLYELADADFREQRFRALHASWFVSLGLGEPLRRALAARPAIVSGTRRCRVLKAASPRDEYADLLSPRAGASGHGDAEPPLLAIRLRPQTLVDVGRLSSWLRRELLQIADLLDPEFGFDRRLDLGEGAQGLENLMRERYRLLWDVTVDGRLAAADELPPGCRERRRQEFGAAFAMLGESAFAAFERLFRGPRPSHAELAALARDPGVAGGGAGRGTAGRCPVCRMASYDLLPGARVGGSGLVTRIRQAAPGWSASDGVCRQCLDLLEGRPATL